VPVDASIRDASTAILPHVSQHGGSTGNYRAATAVPRSRCSGKKTRSLKEVGLDPEKSRRTLEELVGCAQADERDAAGNLLERRA